MIPLSNPERIPQVSALGAVTETGRCRLELSESRVHTCTLGSEVRTSRKCHPGSEGLCSEGAWLSEG